MTEHPLYAGKNWSNLLFFTDPHVASSNPIARKDDYQDAILDKLVQISQLASKLNATMICGGDVWHSKSPTQTSHETVQKLIDLWRNNPPRGIVGNHDIPWGTNDLTSLARQPLGVLVKAGAYFLLHDDSVTMEASGVESGNAYFAIKGVHYQSDGLKDRQLQVGSDDGRDGLGKSLKVLVLHVNASPTGSDFPGNDLCYSYRWLADNSDADVICLGHWHKDQGVQSVPSPEKQTGATHFVNVGAISRNSLREDNLGRTPKCALIRFQAEDPERGIKAPTLEIHEIKLRCAPDADVFKIEEKVLQKARELDVQSFLSRLNSGKLFALDIESLLRESTDDPKVLEAALRIFQESKSQ